MMTLHAGGWVFYFEKDKKLNPKKVGKWMYFFNDLAFAQQICKKAIIENIVKSAKHSDRLNENGTGVVCFYLEIDDVETHKKVLQFMLDNHLIPKTKSGKLKNISFKLDEQTGNGEYKEKFKAKLKLENFIDLETEKWIKKDNS